MDAAQHDQVAGRRLGVGRGLGPAEGPGKAEHADDPPGQGDEAVQRRHRSGHRRGGARREDLGDGRQRHAVALAAAGADEVIVPESVATATAPRRARAAARSARRSRSGRVR